MQLTHLNSAVACPLFFYIPLNSKTVSEYGLSDIIILQVILLNCQPIVLGYLSGFFAQLGTLNLAEQVNNTECYSNVPLEIVSTRDAYLFAGGRHRDCACTVFNANFSRSLLH